MEDLSVLPFEIPVMTMTTTLHRIPPAQFLKERRFSLDPKKK
jgi:hypothetical protein